jgi:hypothetical protein
MLINCGRKEGSFETKPKGSRPKERLARPRRSTARRRKCSAERTKSPGTAGRKNAAQTDPAWSRSSSAGKWRQWRDTLMTSVVREGVIWPNSSSAM